MNDIEKAFDKITTSALCRLDGPEIDLCQCIIDLCNAIEETETDESTWALGESGEFMLGDFIAGAFWSLTEWHAGQHSIEYAALCSLGSVFSPGMTNGPEPESGEQSAYELCNEYFEGLKGGAE